MIMWSRKHLLLGSAFAFTAALLLGNFGLSGKQAEAASDVSKVKMEEIRAQIDSMQAEIVEKGYTFSVDYTPVMNIPIHELCGFVRPENAGSATQAAPLPRGSATLPSSFDWRDHDGVTPVKDQGSCGSCWAFGTVAPLESQIKIHYGTTVDLSEQYLVSCNQYGWGCDGGSWAHDYHLASSCDDQRKGGVLESDFRYAAADLPCGGPYPNRLYKIKEWHYVGSWDDVPSIDAIKQAIYNFGPVAAAVCAGSLFSGYSGGIFDADETWGPYCQGQPNHAITLVGWNDDLGPNNGYWILKNSWGNSWWGESGYMKIRYNKSLVGYSANYVVLLDCSSQQQESGLGPDFDVNGRTDWTVWRPQSGQWFGKDPQTGQRFDKAWGINGDISVVGDFDGDKKTDIGVWRPANGMWYILLSSSGYSTSFALKTTWGNPGDVPVPADYNGDGVTDLGIWRPSNGYWYVKATSGNEITRTQWGASGDIPVPADYDGDGFADLAIWRPVNGYWYVKTIYGTELIRSRWGNSGDVPVPADFNNDGMSDLAVWRPATGYWYVIDRFGTEIVRKQYGINGDIPGAGDYDGDGKIDLVMFRPQSGQWNSLTAASGFTTGLSASWGSYADLPIIVPPLAALKKYLQQIGYY